MSYANYGPQNKVPFAIPEFYLHSRSGSGNLPARRLIHFRRNRLAPYGLANAVSRARVADDRRHGFRLVRFRRRRAFCRGDHRLDGSRRGARRPGPWRLAGFVRGTGRRPLHSSLGDRLLSAGSGAGKSPGDSTGGPRALPMDCAGQRTVPPEPAAPAAIRLAPAVAARAGGDVQRHGLARRSRLPG
jgi:hypothetical protein